MARLASHILMLVLLSGCSAVETSGYAPTSKGDIAYHLTAGAPPTVVFQSGLGDGKAVWSDVLAALPPTLATFAYDRPGYGDSDTVSGSRDPCTIAVEQHQVLASSGARPPYILVGHSLGGLYEYVYARLYPGEVAGLVLLDPTHPRHWQRMKDELPTTAALLEMATLGADPVFQAEFRDQIACLDRLNQQQPLMMPTRLLVQTNFSLIEQGKFEQMTRELARNWQRLTGAPRVEPVENSGHYIQNDRPDAVVAAIMAVMGQAGF